MAGEYGSFKKVLSTINDKKGLNKDNIIEEIKTELEKQDKDLYEEWEKGGFDVNHVFPIYSKSMLLTIAAENGYANIVKILLEKGADVNEKEIFHMTPLHLAAKYGHVDIVKVLLQAGADVNEKEIFHMTPLHFAAKYGHVDIVKVLLQAGADVNAVDRYGRTPLDRAEEYGEVYAEGYAKSKNVIKAILEAGGGSFVKARNKSMIAGGVNTLLGTAIAVALFTTGTITVQLIPIVIAVVAVTAVALVVGCATYELLKPSTEVGGVEKPIVNLTQGVTSVSS